MGVEPMTYGFFDVYKAVALPLSYRGEHELSRSPDQHKISRHIHILGGRVCGAHSIGGPDERIHSWEALTGQEGEHCTASCTHVAEPFLDALD